MDSKGIILEILNGIRKAIDLGYNRLYVNVDDLENDFGFLRVLAMKDSKDIIVFEGTFPIDACYLVLDLLGQSKYPIKDFTMRR